MEKTLKKNKTMRGRWWVSVCEFENKMETGVLYVSTRVGMKIVQNLLFSRDLSFEMKIDEKSVVNDKGQLSTLEKKRSLLCYFLCVCVWHEFWTKKASCNQNLNLICSEFLINHISILTGFSSPRCRSLFPSLFSPCCHCSRLVSVFSPARTAFDRLATSVLWVTLINWLIHT
jgi:hypothetical protein